MPPASRRRKLSPSAPVNATLLFDKARSPASAFSPVPVAEATTYYPFVFARDEAGDVSVLFGNALYNPNVTPPVVSALSAAPASPTAISVSLQSFDAVGVAAACVYLSLLDASLAAPPAPNAQDILAVGDVVSPSGTSAVTRCHSPVPGALSGTARYRVFTAVADAAGNTAVAQVDANTLDDALPAFDSFVVSPGGCNAIVTWAASDPGPHGRVSAVHLLCTADPAAPTPEQTRDLATLSSPSAAASATLAPPPAYLDSHVYGVAEDATFTFGNPANRLSAVAHGAIPVPTVFGGAFDQAGAEDSVAATVDAVHAQAGPVRVFLYLYTDSAPATDAEIYATATGGSAYVDAAPV